MSVGKFICIFDYSNMELLNGKITKVIESYRTTHSPLGNTYGYDVVEVAVNHNEVPVFNVGNTKYEACKVDKDRFVLALKPVNLF